MNPVKIGLGKSFKGLASYLLHDAGHAQTSDRVGWVQSFNLDDADPDRAWRLMAATAKSADQLKEAAGHRKSKASKNTAYHFSISFDPADNPSQDVQRAAVAGALKAIGLQDYQALAISHTDTPHAHIHVMVNLINPENGISAASKQPDGRAAIISNDTLRLSKWAQKFERDHGLKVTPGRQENANKRAAGEKVDARRDPRSVYEQKKHETQDRRREYVKTRFEDAARDLMTEGRAMKERHAAEWTAAKAGYRTQSDARFEAHKAHSAAQLAALKEDNKRRWSGMYMRHRGEIADFRAGEKTVLGRIWHAAAAFKEIAREESALGAFLAAFSRTERENIVRRKHDREKARLERETRAAYAARIKELNDELHAAKTADRLRYLSACDELKARQGEAHAAQRERWKAHNAARAQALAKQRAPVQDMNRDRNMEWGRGRGLEPEL